MREDEILGIISAGRRSSEVVAAVRHWFISQFQSQSDWITDSNEQLQLDQLNKLVFGEKLTMAKQVVHGEESRAAILRGVNQLADAVKVTLGPERPQRRHRQEIRLADDHQRRCDRCERDRVERHAREHGRADGPRSRFARPRTLPVTERRPRRFSRRRSLRKASARLQRVQTRWPSNAASKRQSRRLSKKIHRLAKPVSGDADRTGRNGFGQRRQDDRHDHRRSDGQGRQRRRHHRRRVEDDGHRCSKLSRECSSTAAIFRRTSSPILTVWKPSSTSLSS